jgi:hypothetical protein
MILFLTDREHCKRDMQSFLKELHTLKAEFKVLKFEGENTFSKQTALRQP